MTRILTAVVGMPIVVGITLWGPDWLYVLLVAGVAGIAFDEYLAVTGSRAGTGRWAILPGFAVTTAFYFGPDWALIVLSLAVVVVMAASLAGPVSAARDRILSTTSGLVYAAALPGFLFLVPRSSTLLLMAIVWAGDVGAYYGGRTLGQHLLAPKISPKKTVEGAVLGLAASLGAGFAFASLANLPGLNVQLAGHNGGARLAAIVVTVAAAAQVGDLAESALKRSAGVKDSSGLLPGHGGMLDRIDGLLFALPVFYFLWGL